MEKVDTWQHGMSHGVLYIGVLYSQKSSVLLRCHALSVTKVPNIENSAPYNVPL